MTTVGNGLIGKSIPRIDGPSKTTGRAEYTADVKLEGMLSGRILRSPFAHARIKSIDTSKAKAVPGVHAVVTAADTFDDARYGRAIVDIPVLASDVVRYVGEQVAAVAADDEDIADRALQLIEVEYEELESVHDPEEAMTAAAPLLHPNVMNYQGLPKPLEAPSNNYTTFDWSQGDVEAGLAAADIVVENTFTTPRQHQGYMEPHSCVVDIDAGGRLHVWAGNKSPYPARRFLAIATGLEQDQIVLHPVTIGGDFGGKGSPLPIPIAHMLARATGRPVKIVFEYSEDLIAANPRHPAVIHMRTGVNRDGTIVAHDSIVIFDSGAYAGYKPGGHLGGAGAAAGPYKIPNGRVVEYQVYTNNVPCGYMRGPGEPQTMFAVESQIDCVARAIGMDPAEIRRKNLITGQEKDTIGRSYNEARSVETVEAAIGAAGYTTDVRVEGSVHTAQGLATGERAQAGGETHASVTLNEDGSAVVHTTVFEQGTGSYTVFQQLAADGLGLPLDQVTVEVWDTDSAPFDSGIGGARVTRMGSIAIHDALEHTKDELFKITSELLGWPDDKLAVSGHLVTRSDTGESEDWRTIIKRTGDPIVGQGETKDNSANPWTSFTTQIAEVAVDTETGQVRLLKLTTAHDIGTVLNPVGFYGQINGGAVQGIGYGLTEELILDHGHVQTTSFADYKLPSIADIPELRTVLLEPTTGIGPYNVKGIGEHSNAQTAPAIANAVEAAVGVRIRDLPVTAEKVFRALHG
ncbi:MAG: xanthine dehydrogenase family protein molybdopterin-binding subunit [Chloroflexi bacterium]|nr:xanthine dehydrogenase family protein molybdopterin-binding subunit [Chloroflexota bacterium]MDA1174505.1 xanthine dehydrogenase family protein molybdopterin-binding subunit [Chloroflexota bacterium]